MPVDCPDSLKDVVGYDPFDKNTGHRPDIWPAPVALLLNDGLETDYPMRY